MRKEFQSYYRPTKQEFASLWKNGIFVFDTNVLLSLYAYTEKTRADMFAVLGRLRDRIWLPYHVGLEYNRNRAARISDVGEALRKSKDRIEKGRADIQAELAAVKLAERELGLTDLDSRMEALVNAHDGLLQAMAIAAEKLPKVSLDDPIRDKLGELFEGRIGTCPTSQDQVNDWIADAHFRYANGIPPGFEDADKEARVFCDGGITYEPKHGDLILWKQLLQEIRGQKWQYVAFVTSDAKSDWWLKHGQFTLGPRPELIQEAIKHTENGLFWMYSTDRFLEESRRTLQTPVSDESINRVREVSARLSAMRTTREPTSIEATLAHNAQGAVLVWLAKSFPECTLKLGVLTDLVVVNPAGKKWGVEVNVLRGLGQNMVKALLHLANQRHARARLVKEVDELAFVMVIPAVSIAGEPEENVHAIAREIKSVRSELDLPSIVVGTLSGGKFFPLFADGPEFQPQ